MANTKRLPLALCASLAIIIPTPIRANLTDADFLAQSRAAMSKMMNAMDVSPSGDVDADFVSMMVPHHQGAIDMAAAELRFGRNVALRRIAQEIVVTQRDEIVAMRRALVTNNPGAAGNQ